jgi:hypothetical protein
MKWSLSVLLLLLKYSMPFLKPSRVSARRSRQSIALLADVLGPDLSNIRQWKRGDSVIEDRGPKHQSVRKLLDMLNGQGISANQAKKYFETILSNWPDFQLSETGWYRLLDGAIKWRFANYAIQCFDVMNEQGIIV